MKILGVYNGKVASVTYFDGKISIMIWILLAGLRGINKFPKREPSKT